MAPELGPGRAWSPRKVGGKVRAVREDGERLGGGVASTPSPGRKIGGRGEPEPAGMTGGAVISTGSPVWGCGVSGGVVPRSGLVSLKGRGGVAGWAGRDLLGVGVRRFLKVFLERGGPGKNCVCSVVRPHVAWTAGQRFCEILSWLRNESWPLELATRTKVYRPFRRGEDRCCLVGLFMRRNKPHVSRRDPDEGGHIVVASNGSRVPRCVVP